MIVVGANEGKRASSLVTGGGEKMPYSLLFFFGGELMTHPVMA